MKVFENFPDSWSLALALGSLGGLLLICVTAFLGSGPKILVGFAAITLTCILVIRAERIDSFKKRFGISMGSFVLSTLLVYLALVVSPQTAVLSVGEHSWRLFFVLAVSALVSLPVARLSRSPSP